MRRSKNVLSTVCLNELTRSNRTSRSLIDGEILCSIGRNETHFSWLFSFWYLKLHALTEIKDFEGLDTFSKTKRSPIGYESFVRHLVDKGYAKEGVTYVSRCDSPKRVDLYVECGEWRLAGKECKERGDKAKLE
jgi:hypothetical protein